VRSLVAAHRNLILILLALLFVLLWGLPTLVIPFGADQSWFALGARTLLDGDKLYADFHEQKTPTIYLLYAIPQLIAGDGFDAVRVFDLGITLLSMGGIYLLARRFLPHGAAVLAALAYAFVYLTTVGTDGLGETEAFIAAPLTAAIAIYPVSMGRRWLPAALGSGLALGFALSLKFSVAPFVLALPVMELVLRDRRTWRPLESVLRLSVAAMGFLLVQGVWVGYLVAAGIMDDFIDIQRHYTLPYQDLRWSPGGVPFYRHLLTESEGWMSRTWFLVAPAWVGVMALLVRGSQRAGYLFGFLIAVAILTVWWQGKFFQYHWIITLPFLAIPAGYLLHEGLDNLRGLSRTATVVAVLAGVVGLGLMLVSPLLRTYDAYGYLIDRESGDRIQAEIDAVYSSPLVFNHELVDYVLANSEEDEGFVIWGTWPQALLWADRPSPTRFITSPAVRSDWAPAKWREEYVADLQADPPRFFVVADYDFQPWLTGTDHSSREDFCDYYPALRAFIEANYQPVYENPVFILYDRDAEAPSAFGACMRQGG
jgi:hypothetical protein